MFFFRTSNPRSRKSRCVVPFRSTKNRRLRLGWEALEARTVLSTVSWINASGGDWSTPANWSGDAVPNVTQDAIINIAVSGPITIDSADAAHSLTDTSASLDLTGGSLSLAAASSVSQNVTISVHSVLASAGNLTIAGTLSESGGVLTGGGTVTVNGLLTWTGGTMSGSGTTLAEAGLQLGDAAHSDSESLEARTFQNAGAATWASKDTLDQSANSIFENLAHATLTVQSGVTWNAVNGSLDNQFQGTLTVKAGTGSASFNGFLSNEGDLEVSSGTLVLGAGGTVTGNTLVDAGATIQFGGTQYEFQLGAGLTGQGTVTFGAPFARPDTIFDAGSAYSFSGATNIQAGATAVFDAIASTETLNESGGDLGGSGTFTVAGMDTWTGGTMSGSGITNSLGGVTLGASGATQHNETLAGRLLLNAGAGVWYGPDVLTQEESSTFLNYSNATLKITGGATWGYDSLANDPLGTFENNGAIIVAGGSAPTVVQPYFINSGKVEVASGTLQLGGGGTCPWNALAVAAGFTVDSGASLLLGNSGIYTSASTHEAYAFVSGGYISGAGSVTFGSGVSANFAVGSTYNPSGQTVIDTGSPGINVVFTTGSHVGPLGNLTIDPGLVDFSTGATVTAASLNLTGGGILTGSDTLDVSGILTWINGTMDGPGATVAEGGLDLGAGGYLHSNLESRTLINQGTANWAGSGEIDLDAGATFINQSNATFNEHTNTLIRTDGGGFAPSGLFDNRGTFVVHGGGMATMESRFNNEGQVQISSGTWVLSDVGTSSGDFIMNAGASLQLDPLYGIPYTTDLSGHFANSPQIIGGNGKNVTLTSGAGKEPTPLGAITKIAGGFYEETGTVTLSSLDMTGGWLTIKGTLDVVGPMTWTGGFIVGPGSLSVQGGLTLGTGTATTQVLSGVTLFNQSTMTLTAKDVFDQEGGATVVNQILHTVDLQAGAAWTGDGTVVIDNQGTIEATAGTGRATVYDIALVNDGTVTVNSGTLNLEGGGTATGAFTALAQTTLEFGLYSWAFNSTSNVTGAGTVEFTYDGWSSYFNANSIYKVTGTTVIQSGGHYVGVDFIGGDIENLGSLMLEGGTLDFSSGNPVSAASLTQSNGTLLTGSDPVTVSGQLTWKGGVMSGTGSTVADGTLQLGASGDKSDVEILMVRTLKANGGGAIEPLDTLLQFYGSTFVNTAADTLDLGGGVKWESVGDGTSAIDNQGALIVGIVGEAVVSPPTIQGDGNFPFLTCPGAIGVYVGGLNLDCNGSATKTLQASFSVLYPCTLVFGGDFTLEGAAGIGGAGNVEVPSGGDLRVTSGASYNVIGTTTIDGGTIEFDDSADTGTLNLSSGDLTGTGTLTVLAGPTVWTGGTMDGVGNTITRGFLDIGLARDSNDTEILDGRTLTNAGTATWAGGGSFRQVNGATFVNQTSANLDIENGLIWSNDGTGTFLNAGTLVKAAGTGATTLQTALDNTGNVQVQQGILSFQGAVVVGGSYLVQAGATLTFGRDKVTTTSLALPSDFTSSPLKWNVTISGTAQDKSRKGLASVGVSLFDGTHYFNGTAFASHTAVFNTAALTGSSWSYTIGAGHFRSDLAYAAASKATDKLGGNEPSTITSLLLAR